MKTKAYKLADSPSSAELREILQLLPEAPTPPSAALIRNKLRAIPTKDVRAPKKGEWYISGAIPEAYRAPNDLSTEFRIAKIVYPPALNLPVCPTCGHKITLEDV